MKFFGLIILIIGAQQCLAGETENFLNAMQQLMYSSDEPYRPDFYERLVNCFEKIEPGHLLEAVDAQWKGFHDYSDSHGTATDPWHTCDEMRWYELNCTTQEYGNVAIFEPCNYASNVAYYFTVTEICDRSQWTLTMDHVNAMAKTFAILAQGSAFMHGSNTNNGGSADVRINDLFTYVAYQAAVSNLEPKDNSIIHDLNYTSRAKSGIELTNDYLDMYIGTPVAEWGNLLDTGDFPSVRAGMCSFFATSLTLVYDPLSVDLIVSILFDLFTDMPEDLRQFCLHDYLAEIRTATAHIKLTPLEKANFMGNVFGTVIKLVYAFVWQEEVLVANPIFLDPFVNKLGTILLPVVNDAATALTTFSYSSPDFIHGVNMYPGHEWCSPTIPHAKWHLQTGIALADFVFLADEINKIFLDYAPLKK